MSKLSAALLLLCLSLGTFAQNYNATTGFICQAYTYREGTLLDAPYMFQNVQFQINWVYCGPWSGSNNGNMNFDIFLSDGWNDLFTMTDSGNGCSLVTDYYNVPYSTWNEAIDANNGSVLVRATISDSCPGGVGCNWYSDPCFEVLVNFDYEPLEAPQANFGVDSETACTGQTISISDLSAGTGLTYSWNFGAGAVPATSNSAGNQNVYYATPGTKTISLTVSNLLGNNVSTFQVEVNPSPELTITPDFSACDNVFPVTIAADGIGSFQWADDLGTEPEIEIAPEITSTYTVALTNEFNCTSTASVEVSVLESPVIDAGNDAVICLGESILLVGDGNGDIYWEHNPEGGLMQELNPVDHIFYVLHSSFENGCFSTDTAFVTVNPVPDAFAGTNQEICLGESIILSANGGSSFEWDNDLGSGASQIVNPSETTLYTVIVGNEQNCFDESSVLITVNPVPTASTSDDIAICYGESVIISASGGIDYEWNQGLGNGAEHEVSPETTTIYYVDVINEYNCSAQDSVEITVHPNIEPSIMGLSGSPFCHNDPNAYNLLGSPSGGTFTGFGVNGSQFFPANAGIGPIEITYTYEDEFECSYTQVQLIEVEICEGILEYSDLFEIYPNPVEENLTVDLSGLAINIGSLDVLDMNGKVVLTSEITRPTEIVNLSVSHLASGNYILRLNAAEKSVSRRFVKD